MGATIFVEAFEIQQKVLEEFHKRSAKVLGDECRLKDYSPADMAIQRNVFSTLFLATETCAGLSKERLPFYGLINQCMRAWVTGCDNLLDDEYKTVLPFDLPEGGHRARSVLIIMTADRVFSDLLLEQVAQGDLTSEQAKTLSHYTLRALIPSALQEDQEEPGAQVILTPREILDRIHVPKTGLLFEAPLIPPEQMGEVSLERSGIARSGLRAFGLACQILDDIVDLDADLAASHHNFVLSLAAHPGGKSDQNPLPRADIKLESFPIQKAREESCRWSARLFRQAREQLGAIGLEAADKEWRFLVLMIAGLLRVPQECQTVLENAL